MSRCQMPKLSGILATSVGLVGLLGAIGSATAAPQVKQGSTFDSFEEWCLAKADLPEATQHTVAALLDEVSSADCNLAGLQLSSFLTLNLASQGISDLAPLADMKNLQFLILHDNQITDLSPLKDLTDLRVLYLGSNRIRDLGPLASLTNLTQLYLGSNQIQDLRPLSSLVNLEILSLRANQISDISPLRSLRQLHTLFLESNRIRSASTTVSTLSALPNLNRLYLSNNPLSRRICPDRPDMVCFF